jgi:hypothetical protein
LIINRRASAGYPSNRFVAVVVIFERMVNSGENAPTRWLAPGAKAGKMGQWENQTK